MTRTALLAVGAALALAGCTQERQNQIRRDISLSRSSSDPAMLMTKPRLRWRTIGPETRPK